MTLADLESQESFALLGPGYGHGGFVLLQGLVADAEAPGRGGGRRDAPSATPAANASPLPRLVFADFETAGSRARIFTPSSRVPFAPHFGDPAQRDVRVDFDPQGIREAVLLIRESIEAGDVYQVCFTHRAPVAASSGATLLSAMCGRGVPPFAAWVRLPGGPEFVSASPERFFDIDGRIVRSEPMKGTAHLADEDLLVLSQKDRCELSMITDLVRHDLAAVCLPRSIRVACDRRILHLPYALQAVSDVEGVLRPAAGPIEVLDALHPGGSVVGAPKEAARAMIGRLESTPRGPYCGALGLWEGDRAGFGLLIRTATRTPTGWTYGVGSGIVYDSDPDSEIEEFRTKLGALGCVARPCE